MDVINLLIHMGKVNTIVPTSDMLQPHLSEGCYVHSQDIPASTWEIRPGIEDDVEIFVYKKAPNVGAIPVVILREGEIFHLHFTTEMTGVAIVMTRKWMEHLAIRCTVDEIEQAG